MSAIEPSALAVFPLTFATEDLRLLTAIVLGFLFGFSLERGGFGNARKLAAQFYFRDMAVFKVMFTAILVAMVGLYSLAAVGLVDTALLWINPTFVWAQVVGGFLLGVGFIMSGLCPGTSVVSAASGRWDAVATFAGIFVGIGVFVVAVDAFPALERLYSAGDLGVSVLPTVLGVPPLVFALGAVAVAAAGFLGAEWVERRSGGIVGPEPGGEDRVVETVEIDAAPETTAAPVGRAAREETLPPAPSRFRWAVTPALLAAIAVVGLAAARPAGEPAARSMEPVAPLALAEEIIAGDPALFVVDLRGTAVEERVPGAYAAGSVEEATGLLQGAPAGARVVVYDATGARRSADGAWPSRLDYRFLEGGWAAWELAVLTPAPLDGRTLAERAWAARQNQISGYFTGAAVQSGAGAPAPLPMPAGGAQKKRKGGGC